MQNEVRRLNIRIENMVNEYGIEPVCPDAANDKKLQRNKNYELIVFQNSSEYRSMASNNDTMKSYLDTVLLDRCTADTQRQCWAPGQHDNWQSKDIWHLTDWRIAQLKNMQEQATKVKITLENLNAFQQEQCNYEEALETLLLKQELEALKLNYTEYSFNIPESKLLQNGLSNDFIAYPKFNE